MMTQQNGSFPCLLEVAITRGDIGCVCLLTMWITRSGLNSPCLRETKVARSGLSLDVLLVVGTPAIRARVLRSVCNEASDACLRFRLYPNRRLLFYQFVQGRDEALNVALARPQ